MVVRETKRAVTPWGGIVLLVQFLKEIRYVEALEKAMPIQMNSPNAIAPAHTFTAFLIAVAAGARFAHAGLLRTDREPSQM